jgi:hypothetical protein
MLYGITKGDRSQAGSGSKPITTRLFLYNKGAIAPTSPQQKSSQPTNLHKQIA